MNVAYTSLNPMRDSLESELKLSNNREKATLAGTSDSAGELLKKSDTERPADLLSPTDLVDISQDARALLAAEESSGENDEKDDSKAAPKAAIDANNIAKGEDSEDSDSEIEKLKKQIQQVQEKLTEAQQELSRASTEAASSDDPLKAQDAQSKVQAAQQEVVALTGELQALTTMLQEAMQASAS